jgi:hypothetical protein
MGDFYPLSPYSTADDTWMAWQFNREELQGGMVHAHRRADCYFRSADFVLRGLDPRAKYQITNLETGEKDQQTGEDLMTKGIYIAIKDKPGSVIFKYEKVN